MSKSPDGVVHYTSINRELKIKPISECRCDDRCDERLKTKVEESVKDGLAVAEDLLGNLML
jgi:hypothetical protein